MLPYMRRLLTRRIREPPPHDFVVEGAAIEDGMASLDTEAAALRFGDDLRLLEVRRLLQSSAPALLSQRSMAASDTETAQTLQSTLHTIATRTLSLSVGESRSIRFFLA